LDSNKLTEVKAPATSTAASASKPAAASQPPSVQLSASKLMDSLTALSKTHPSLTPQLIASAAKAITSGQLQELKGLAAAAKLTQEQVSALVSGAMSPASASASATEKDTTPLHWKYHLMASACLFALTCNDTPASNGQCPAHSRCRTFNR
jgi:hypothetical protein